MKEWIIKCRKTLSHKQAPAPGSTAEHSEGLGASESAAGDKDKGACSVQQTLKGHSGLRYISVA